MPKRRTKAEIDTLKAAIVAISEEHQPLTIRHLFYLMVSQNLIDKTEKEYKGTVVRLATILRENGTMPFEWIVDGGRGVRQRRGFKNKASLLSAAKNSYFRDLWQDQDIQIQVWIEKDALVPVVEEITSEFQVGLYACRGYPSLSLLHDAALDIMRVDKDAHLFYFGDHDPSGVDIPRVVDEALSRYMSGWCGSIDFTVVAITEPQIEKYNLPTRPTKPSDSRSANFDGESVELDALPPEDLRRMVRESIDGVIDHRELNNNDRIEKKEKKELDTLISSIQ